MSLFRSETYTTTGTKVSWNLDTTIAPFNAAVQISLAGGTASYSLQYSLESLGVTDTDSAITWITSTDIPLGTAATIGTGFLTPIARIRLVIAALSAGASLKMTLRQGYTSN